jgi:hypothetical protein
MQIKRAPQFAFGEIQSAQSRRSVNIEQGTFRREDAEIGWIEVPPDRSGRSYLGMVPAVGVRLLAWHARTEPKC